MRHRLFSSTALHVNQMHVFSVIHKDDRPEHGVVTSFSRVDMKTECEVVLTPSGEIGAAVLFSNLRLRKLHSRIFELETTNKTERANYKELLRTKRRLERAKVALDAQITKLRTKCDDLQMLK